MVLTIYGAIFSQNGIVPANIGSSSGKTEAIRKDAGIQTEISYKWYIAENGDFVIELYNVDNIADTLDSNPKNVQDLLRVAVGIIESVLLMRVTVDGIGLLYIIKSVKRPDGTIMTLPPASVIKETYAVPFDLHKLIGPDGFGRNIRLRNAVKDFNWALLDRDSAPFFLYREIETLAKMVLMDLEYIHQSQWEEFYDKIKASAKEREVVETTIKKRYGRYSRHGTYYYYKPVEFAKMLIVGRVILTKTIAYCNLLKEGCTIDDADSFLSQL